MAASGWASSFGRFGWSHDPVAPGFRFDASGFSADTDSADRLLWGGSTAWRVSELSDRHAHYVPVTQGILAGLESNLRAPGFVMEFTAEASLSASVLLEPILTIKEASFGPGIEVPESPWVVVSLGPGQPPVLAAGLDAPIRAKVSGKAGSWTIRLRGPKRVRFCLPRGHVPVPDRTARTLGAVAKAVDQTQSFWSAEAPSLLALDVHEESGSIVARWQFDRPGSIVPPAVLLAKQAGCPIQVESLVRLVEAPLSDGPTAFADEAVLTIRFPLLPFAPGTPLVRDVPASLGAMSPSQVFLGSLFSGIVSEEDRVLAREGLAAGLTRANQPVTGVPIGFDGSGKGSLTVALLALARRLRSDAENDENPSRNELLWAQDARDQTLWLPGQEAADATGVLALELALEARPARRLAGSMLATGLVAQGVLSVFREKYGLRQQRVYRSRYEPLARRLAGLPQGDGWIRALDSPLRIVGGAKARLGPGGLLMVEVPPSLSREFSVLSPSKVVIESVDPDSKVAVTGTVNYVEVMLNRTKPGTAVLKITMDRWEKQVPAWPGWPDWLQGRR